VLKNQYFIAQRQFEMMNLLDGQVQFLITECSLPQVLFYNENYENNVCDVEKTRKQILAWHQQYKNVNVLVQRNPDKKYVHSGRLQDEEQARAIDAGLRGCLNREGIKFTALPPSPSAIEAFANALV